jgi:hypothetical protein
MRKLSKTSIAILFMDDTEAIVEVSSADKLRARRDLGIDAEIGEVLSLMLWYAACRAGLADPNGDWLSWHETVAIFDAVEDDDEGDGLGEDGTTLA